MKKAYAMPKGFEIPVSPEEAKRYGEIIKAEHKIEIIDISDDANAKVVQVYADVIERGAQTKGVEYLQILDRHTGETVGNMIVGQKGKGEGIRHGDFMAEFKKANGRAVITVHNHENGATFSMVDLITTAKYENIIMAAAIGHDGSVYETAVSGTNAIIFSMLNKEYMKIRDTLVAAGKYSSVDVHEMEQILRSDAIEELCYNHNWRYSRRYYYEP